MHGAHLGDVLMALPAVGGLVAQGELVSIICHPRIPRCLRSAPVVWTDTGRATVFADYRGVHRSWAWLRAAEVEPHRLTLTYPVGDASTLMPGYDWCVLSPWAQHPDKRWSVENWIDVASFARGIGMRVCIVGPIEAKRSAFLISTMTGAVDLVGQDTPETWPALVQRAAVVISPDTGCVHMADALDVPVIGLYGATKLAEVGPFWNRPFCIERDTMDAITVADVATQLEKARG